MSKPILSIFERHASQSTDVVTLFYSARAAKEVGVYTAVIHDDKGNKTPVTYTNYVTDPKAYLWDDKKEVATCERRQLQDIQVSTGAEARNTQSNNPLMKP